MKKRSRKIKKSKPLATGKQHFEVLLENIESQISLIAEQTSEIPGIKVMLKNHEERFENIDTNIDIIKIGMSVMRKDIDTMKMDIDVMKTDIDVIKMDVSTIKNNLKQKIDLEDFENLEQRVAMLEARRV